MMNNEVCTLEHPEHGELPAKQILECIFVLAPNGRILHFHEEQMRPGATEGVLVLTDTPPHEERSRCQIIPPFVPDFKRNGDTA